MAASAFPFSLSAVMLKSTSATASIGTTTMITKKRRSRRRKLMLAWVLCTRILAGQRRLTGVLRVGHMSRSWSFVASRPLLRRRSEPRPAATMDAQTLGAIAQLGERLDRTQEV